MQGRPRISAGLAACLLVGLAVAAEAQRSASVGGRVEDEADNPLPGVLVTVFSPDETRSDTTNKKGRFRVVVMDSTSRLMIRLEKEGYATIEEPIQAKMGETVSKVWQMAAVASSEVLEGDSEAIESYNAGASAYNAGDYQQARASFEQALEADPDLMEARKVLTLVYFQLQEWDLAASSARIVSDAEPTNDAALKVGFDASSQLRDRERAVVFLDRLVALGGSTDTARRVFNHGVGALRDGEREEAVARFESAIEIDPTLGVAYTGLASVYLEDEAYEQALEAADRLLAVDPGNAEGLGIRYEAYRRLGDEANMKLALDELQAADPERIVDAYYQQGMLLFNEGSAQAAVEAFERVLSAAPDHARAHYQLGRAYLSAGDYEKGRQYLERFIEMAPSDPEVEGAKAMLAYLD